MSMVARSQTVEDGGPRRPVLWHLLQEGTADETMRVEMVIRRPYSLMDFTQRLVIRANRHTEEITASLEAIRTE
jgi:hypothetical protein